MGILTEVDMRIKKMSIHCIEMIQPIIELEKADFRYAHPSVDKTQYVPPMRRMIAESFKRQEILLKKLGTRTTDRLVPPTTIVASKYRNSP